VDSQLSQTRVLINRCPQLPPKGQHWKAEVAKAFQDAARKLEFSHRIKVTRVDNIAPYPNEIIPTVSHRATLLGEDLVATIGKLRKTVFPKGNHSPSKRQIVSLERDSTEIVIPNIEPHGRLKA